MDKRIKKFSIVSVALILFVAVVAYAFADNLSVFAASTYTVDSIGDQSDDNPGNNVCHTAVNTCTLRAAIEEANAHANVGGNDVINFGITGSGLHTIQPASAYANITDGVTINGYSQTGSSANTAVSPNPFNGTLTIEINGQNAGANSGLFFTTGSSNSIIRGLVVNRFEHIGIEVDAADIVVAGNYIGTNSAGLTDLGNEGSGVGSPSSGSGVNLQIGGLNAEDRNLISGNDGAGINPNAGADNWLVQGNYIGVDKTGLVALGNSVASGAGGLSIDDSSGATVGGTDSAATNVISGNLATGIAPLNAPNLTIQGNLIGTDYTGNAAVPNIDAGIVVGGTGSGLLIGGTTVGARNIVSGNGGWGITIGQDGATIQGNYVGLAKNGTPLGNNSAFPLIGGIGLAGNDILVGGPTAAARNYVSGNAGTGISIYSPSSVSTNITIQGNYIGTNTNGEIQSAYGNDGAGIMLTGQAENTLVGGTNSGMANIVAGNGSGILSVGIIGVDTNLNNSFLGNSIYGNSGGTISTLGIDLAGTPDGSSFVNTGVTPNDVGDPDESTNHYINFPVISSVTSSDGTADITYSLDINDSEAGATGYRVEFFANDAADASGHGQGQTYIGFDTVAGDVTNHTASITLPSGVSGAKFITAVTTMTDNSSDGFGHSSEFASNYQAVLAAASSENGAGGSESGNLADTGTNVNAILALVAVLLATGAVGFRFAHKN